MQPLKSLWQLYNDLVSLAWLDRISQKQPRLAMAITGSIISLVLGFQSWYCLDPRFPGYEQGTNIPASWTVRIMGGIIYMGGTIIAIVVTYLAVRKNNPIELSFARRPTTKKAKQ